MKQFVTGIFFIFCTSLGLSAQNDSSYKAPRIILDAGFGIGINSAKTKNRLNYNEDFTYKLKHSEEFNVSILFPNSPFKNNFFYFNVGCSITSFDINHHFNDYQNSDSTSHHYFSYPVNETNQSPQVAGVNVGFSHYWFIDNLMIFQKIGINFNHPLDRINKYDYTETYRGDITMADVNLATAQNPNGYYQNDFTITRNVTDNFTMANSFNPYLHLGVGYKIKCFAPFLNVQINGYNFNTIVKPTVGVMMLIK